MRETYSEIITEITAAERRLRRAVNEAKAAIKASQSNKNDATDTNDRAVKQSA